MSALLRNAVAWKLAIVWFCLFSLNALATSIMAALTGAQWNTLDGQSKFMICIAVFANWTGTIMAFLKSNAKKIESGKLPFDDDQTTQIKKQLENG